MVYIESWDDFVERSVQLFRNNPSKTRYVMKYRHSEGKLVLKVTDDKEDLAGIKDDDIFVPFEELWFGWVSELMVGRELTVVKGLCLKFKTDQAQDAKKMEKLNNIFFTLMARGPEADITEVTGKEQAETQPSKKGRGRKQ